jgi:thioredoxin:protein disulfide reductase
MPSRRLAVLVALAISLVPAIAFAGEFDDAQERGLAWMYLMSFGAGFLTSLTPCVYPMIPITLAIFGARGKDVSKRRALALASAYVVGMGVTYAVLGVTVALIFGATAFGSQLSHPAVVIPLVILFLALAASMFGAFELNLPSGLQARLNQIGGKGYGGAFAMGLVGGFIAAPCTGPFLAGLLAFVSTTNSVVTGASLLFVYALGMGVLFWLLAAFALALPKSGAWMDSVKSAGGIGLLLAAVYFLAPIVPWFDNLASPQIWFLLVALALVATGVILGAIHLSFHDVGYRKLRKGLGIAMVVAGLYGAWLWKLEPKQHLPWVTDEKVAYDTARAQGKGVMVDFSASWCVPCKELERTFGDDDVYNEITADFVTLSFDVSDGTDADDRLRLRYGAVQLPTVVFVDTHGNLLGRVEDNHKLGVKDLLGVIRPAVAALRSSKRAQTP